MTARTLTVAASARQLAARIAATAPGVPNKTDAEIREQAAELELIATRADLIQQAAAELFRKLRRDYALKIGTRQDVDRMIAHLSGEKATERKQTLTARYGDRQLAMILTGLRLLERAIEAGAFHRPKMEHTDVGLWVTLTDEGRYDVPSTDEVGETCAAINNAYFVQMLTETT